MQLDRSWKALLKPGEASNFFSLEPLPPFYSEAIEFRSENAWWFAELCRLMYKEIRPERREILDRVGLREVEFYDRRGIQCALVEPIKKERPFSLVVFPGTNEIKDWLSNLDSVPVEWDPNNKNAGHIHKGFADALDHVWNDFFKDRLWSNIKEYVSQIQHPLFYTGHSLGGALATLAAIHQTPQAVYTFGAPRVVTETFKTYHPSFPLYRVVNHLDMVPTVPPEKPLLFTHLGDLYYITREGKILCNPSAVDLESQAPTLSTIKDYFKNIQAWFQPNPYLSDHSPINYVAQIQNSLTPQSSPTT